MRNASKISESIHGVSTNPAGRAMGAQASVMPLWLIALLTLSLGCSSQQISNDGADAASSTTDVQTADTTAAADSGAVDDAAAADSGSADAAGDAGGATPKDDASASPGSGKYSAVGPHLVGVQTIEIAMSHSKTIGAVWYPTKTKGSNHAYPPVFNPTVKPYKGAAYTDVAPDCSAPWPVIVHSHGSTTAYHDMAWLAEHLASHGAVIIAVNHVGNTAGISNVNYPAMAAPTPRPSMWTAATPSVASRPTRSVVRGSTTRRCSGPFTSPTSGRGG